MSDHDVEDFLGRWEVVSGRLGVESIPLPATVLVLAAETYRVDSPQGRDEGRLSWSREGEMLAVQMTGTGGAHAGRQIDAIARVRGRMLQLCYAVDGGARPTSFEAPPGSAWVTVRYRRAE